MRVMLGLLPVLACSSLVGNAFTLQSARALGGEVHYGATTSGRGAGGRWRRPSPRPPTNLGQPMALQRWGCASVQSAVATGGAPTRVFRPTAYGADPTGVTDSSRSFALLLNDMWRDARASPVGAAAIDPRFPDAPNLGGATIDLEGGQYLLSAPLVLPSVGGSNWALQDGTLRAGGSFPPWRYLVEMNITAWPNTTFQGVVLSNLVLDGAGVAGGVACVACNHVVLDRCWVARFANVGVYELGGHEIYISNSWVSQANASLNGTGLCEDPILFVDQSSAMRL